MQKYEARCHTANSLTDNLNEDVSHNIRKQNWSPYSSDLNLLDNAVWGIMKKILYQNLKQYENIERPSAAMSYVWNTYDIAVICMGYISIIQSTNGGCD